MFKGQRALGLSHGIMRADGPMLEKLRREGLCMIQDIGQHRLSNHFVTKQPLADSLVLCCRAMEFLARLSGDKSRDNSGRLLGGSLSLPRVADFGVGPGELELVYLLSVDDVDLFLARAQDVPTPSGFSWEQLRDLRMAEPRWLAFAAATGCQLADWYRLNRFCGVCGHPTELALTSREIVCPACGNIIYPRINPCVIVGVLDGSHDHLLLTRYAPLHHPFPNYALVAGYTEIGETLEQTVRREVAEEVGLTVCNMRYWTDQPWPFSSAILAGFWCEVTGSLDLSVDHSELKDAVWMSREEIPMPRKDSSTLTNAMITAFATGQLTYPRS